MDNGAGKIVVLGGGESGVGSAILAKSKGWRVLLSDNGIIAPQYRQMLEQYDIPFEQGGHSLHKLLRANEIIKSPGIPDTAPIVVTLQKRGVPIISEIEFAGRYTNARTICITGSNGKTTTATLIYMILKEAGFNVGLAGNIGQSFALQVATENHDWYVIELSSFQLDGMSQFRADIGVLTNITPDHLDRYDNKMENYIASKMKIIQNQTETEFFIYCEDDLNSANQVSLTELPMQVLHFGVRKPPRDERTHWQGACLRKEGNRMLVKAAGRSFDFDINLLKIKGAHNVYNAMAASLAAMVAGADDESIRRALSQFNGVEHRMEYVAEIDGVRYINDSKATNIDSTWYALDAMNSSVVWIAGGTDKGNEYHTLEGLVREKVRVLICMGADNTKLLESFGAIVPKIYDTHSMDEALQRAVGEATAEETVLLSPACASFDLFKNYEDRGKQFKEWIFKYKATR